jgi:hypothetical protein
MGQASSTKGETGKPLQEIEELKRKNKGMEEQLRGAVAGCEVGRLDAARRQHEGP